jgi:tRNA pseudouridine38-40 synthase
MPVLLRLAYDGTDFAGCPEAPGRRTVVGELRSALARLGIVDAVETLSRTDAGVHAEAQVAVVATECAWDERAWLHALDRHLPADLRCGAVARTDSPQAVLGKTYRYEVDVSAWGDPFRARSSWRQRVCLDDLVQLAPQIVGCRDFSAFRRRGETRKDLVRTINEAAWTKDGTRLCFHVTGDGFGYRLVRSLVGAQLAVARGACTREDLEAALAGRVTPAAVQQAPARGLCLVSIHLVPEPSWVASS